MKTENKNKYNKNRKNLDRLCGKMVSIKNFTGMNEEDEIPYRGILRKGVIDNQGNLIHHNPMNCEEVEKFNECVKDYRERGYFVVLDPYKKNSLIFKLPINSVDKTVEQSKTNRHLLPKIILIIECLFFNLSALFNKANSSSLL